jgi:hypothetical protein
MAPLKLQAVLPAILAATLCADGVTRALPVGTWSFRAWEALTANNAAATPFQPLAQFDSPSSFGDLANLGNIRDMRVHRRETFTTDAFGFRNPPGLAESGTVSVLLLGDSFAAGSGVSDDLTLAGQLTTTWGHPTYSLAPLMPRAVSLTAFATMLQLKPGGWVVHQQTYSYNDANARVIEPTRHPPVTAPQRVARSFRSDIRPLRIVVNQAWRSVQDDQWLPNPFKAAVTRARLLNGDDMLFRANETSEDGVAPATVQAIAGSVAYAKGLSNEADRLGLHYLAVLVPVKTAVYQHLLAPETGRGPRPPGWVVETERQLQAAGVRVLNLFEPLTRRATLAAARHQYVYWRDDTHWNAAGIATAAEAIAAVMAAEADRAR